MKPSRTIFVCAMIFFVLGIGAKDCNLDWSGSSGGTSAPPPPTKPFCLTDPPIGCAAFCSDVGVLAFTSHCSDVDADMRALNFRKAVVNYLNAKMAEGYDVCPAADVNNKFVPPCPLGFPPVEWPNQDHEVCQTPPLDCSIVLP
jgi:hypothetical protein